MAIQFAAEFFIAMGKLLGQRWVSKHGAVPSQEWQRLLSRFAECDPEELAARIVQRLHPNGRGEVWPPEMADVIAMCKPNPQDFGLPTPEQAYRAANHLRWIHPVVYETARRLGVNDVRSRTERQMFPDFEKTYEQVCSEFMQGKTSNWPKRAKPETGVEHQPNHQRPSADVVKARCDAIRKALGPMPKPAPKPQIESMNDEQVSQGVIANHEELREAAARYRRAS